MITLELLLFLSLGIGAQSMVSYFAAQYYQTEGYHRFWGYNAPYGFLLGVSAKLLETIIGSQLTSYWDAVGLSFLVTIASSFFISFHWTKNIEERERRERQNDAIGFKRKRRG
ncbi:MAG: hypothetical protein HRU41_23155 [Saprospiraceae bacterium]|nr:hypothetical protein [Saprospiraceae bacterium]